MTRTAKPAMARAVDAPDTCPRCGGGFHCGANDATPCACNGLTLSATLRAELGARYAGCLCLRCLAELSSVDLSTAELSTAGPHEKAGAVWRPAGSMEQ